jgi:hypothetical protein
MAMADRLVRMDDGEVVLLGVRNADRWSYVNERRRNAAANGDKNGDNNDESMGRRTSDAG